jgi:tripartite-type tricarboxylate transporter receptor subunit TctC
MRPLGLMLKPTAVVLTLWWPCSAPAQTPAEFYKGRTIEIDVSSTTGGGYDTHARLLARHMPKYIPDHPTIVVRNVDGASGLRLANLLYNTAPKDGTIFGTIYRSTSFDPLFGNKTAQFDASKFTWIGSASNEVSICVAWHTSGIASFEDMLARELIVATGNQGGDATQFTTVVNAVFGTRMKMVSGYPGGNDMLLAMERGEVAGRCGWSWSSAKASRPGWIAEKKINILLQLALTKHPELSTVPLVLDLAKTEEQKAILKLIFARQVIAYPFVAPPGIPPERAEILRAAFMDTMRDKEFLAEAEKAQLEIRPVAGTDAERLIVEAYATPAPVVQKVVEMLK